MTVAIEILCITFAAWLLLRPMRDKPFSEDDGNWFFAAVFRDKGERLYHRGLHTVGYFGIEWMAVTASRIFGRVDSRFFYTLKVVWYWATALAVYWLGAAIWGHGAGFAGALFFLAVVATPGTLFALTYGEHIFLLPLALSLTALHAGLAGGPWWAFLLAGAAVAWMVQIKIVALVYALAVCLALLVVPESFQAVGWYLAGCVLVTALPLVLIPLLEGRGPMLYVAHLVVPLVEYGLGLADKAGLLGLRRWYNRTFTSWMFEVVDGTDSYSGAAGGLARGQRLEMAWRNLRRGVRDCFGVLLAVALLPVLGTPPSPGWVWALLGVAAVFLAIQQLQQNYYTPHFNPLWLPLALVAGLAVSQAVPLAGQGDAAGLAVLGLVAGQTLLTLYRVRQDRVGQHRADVPGTPNFIWGAFRLAEDIGTDVARITTDDDRLFVWGDHPSIYLYARRYFLGRASFFPYGHGGKLRYKDWLLGSIRKRPPEYILFYNTQYPDQWNGDSVGAAVGVLYQVAKTYEVPNTDPGASPVRFDLCRRNDMQWRQALLEQARSTAQAEAALATAQDAFPDDAEFSLVRRLEAADPADHKALLKSELADADTPARAFAARREWARFLARHGDQRLALRHLNEALGIRPGDAGTMAAAGECEAALGNFDKAAELLAAALEHNPYSPDALNNMAVVKAYQGDEQTARALLETALQLVPDHADARRNLRSLTRKG